MQLLGFITLKPNENADSYEHWVREVVHPAAIALPSISRYDVYRVTGPFRPGGEVPYHFTEVVTITSLDEVRRDFARPEIARLLADFATRADAVFLVGEQIS
jgi:REDY-like protein HapK